MTSIAKFKYPVLSSIVIILLMCVVYPYYYADSLPISRLLIIAASLLALVVLISNMHAIWSARLNEQRSLFANMIAAMPIGITVKDPLNNFRYLICNEEAARIFGRSSAEILDHTDFEIFPPDVAQTLRNQDKKLTSNQTTEIVPRELHNFGNGGIWLKISKVPLPAAGGKTSLMLQILEDMSDNVKLESQLRHSQRMDEIGKLAGGVAHEFNNLLQVILGYCEYIRDDDSNEHTITNLEQIEKAATSAMHLTRQLLTYSRKTEMNTEAVELSKVITESLKMVSRIIGDGVEIDFKPSENPIVVMADVAQIGQILVNLCVNARDAMAGNGKITITVEHVVEIQQAINSGIRKDSGQSFGHIRVADNGPGIPVNLRDQLFIPFFTTKDIGKGTGLGLAIIYAIMKQHYGYIFYDDSFNDGSAFDIYIPLANLDELPVYTKAAAIENQVNTENLLILVAEDEPAVRNMNIKLLKKHGFRTLAANNGEEAIELFNQQPHEISALLFDVMMPKLNGKAAYEAISKIKPGIPTVFCTGYSHEDIQSELSEHKNVVILAKPFKANQLINSLKTILTQTIPQK